MTGILKLYPDGNLRSWYIPELWFSCFSCIRITGRVDLLKHRFLSPALRVFDSVDLGWGPRIYISNKFPGDAVAAGPGLTL